MKPFKSKRHVKKCAKIWALLIVYHNSYTSDAPDFICQEVYNYVEKELLSMNLPDGWNRCLSYPDFEQWFINNFK